MTKPKIHVALLGKQETIAHLVIRRRIDELIIVYPKEDSNQADNLIGQLSNLGIIVEPVIVKSNNFDNILSAILTSLDHREFDECSIEFSITSEYCIMTLAACIAAAIVKASIVCATGVEFPQISEVWPSELVNLTQKKREILEHLEKIGCSVSQKDLSRYTGIRPSGVSRHLHDLELAGYIKRSRAVRVKQVQITELGSAILHHKQLRKRRLWKSYAHSSAEGIQTVG